MAQLTACLRSPSLASRGPHARCLQSASVGSLHCFSGWVLLPLSPRPHRRKSPVCAPFTFSLGDLSWTSDRHFTCPTRSSRFSVPEPAPPPFSRSPRSGHCSVAQVGGAGVSLGASGNPQLSPPPSASKSCWLSQGSTTSVPSTSPPVCGVYANSFLDLCSRLLSGFLLPLLLVPLHTAARVML